MMAGYRCRPLAVAAFAIAHAFAGVSVFAMDWPLAPPRIAATFGTLGKGRVFAGIAFSADEGLVRSAENGELSFILDESDHRGILPTPLGSFVIVEHQNGMAAVYSHLAPSSLSAYQRKPKSGDVLGKTGVSGWIEGPGLVFQVFDRLSGSWVNPLLVLPPLANDKPPIIRSLALSHIDKVYVLGETASLPQGTYKISADIVDPADSSWIVGPLAPYSIRLSIDGVEVVKEVFDVAKGEKGRLMLFTGKPTAAAELRTREGRYSLAERLFTRGRTTIELHVEDAIGNKRSVSWSVLVE